MAGIRVVLDTNVLVSGLAYPASIPGRIIAVWRQGALDVVLSHYILVELTSVLPRLPRMRLSPTKLQDLVDSLLFLADIVEPQGLLEKGTSDQRNRTKKKAPDHRLEP
jgi:predicted nucleic acid-binding protein